MGGRLAVFCRSAAYSSKQMTEIGISFLVGLVAGMVGHFLYSTESTPLQEAIEYCQSVENEILCREVICRAQAKEQAQCEKIENVSNTITIKTTCKDDPECYRLFRERK